MRSQSIVVVGRWMDEHRDAYLGRWVALDGDQLVAVGASVAELRALAATSGRTLGGLFITKVT